MMFPSFVDCLHQIENVARTLLPAQCVSCHGRLISKSNLCTPCISALPRILKFCPRCGDPMEESSGLAPCNVCRICPSQSDKFYFRQSRSLFHYTGSIRTLVTDFKFSRGLAQGRCLAEQLAGEYRDFYRDKSMPEMILPVPLHPARLRERGYNQAQELAETVARICGQPTSANYLLRIRDTPRQTSLNAGERRRNLLRAFTLSKLGQRALSEGHSRTFAIIDDVVTTHSTSNAVCKLLARHGAAWVDVWSIARA